MHWRCSACESVNRKSNAALVAHRVLQWPFHSCTTNKFQQVLSREDHREKARMGVWPCISSFCVFYGTALGVRHQGLNPSSNPLPKSLDPTPAARSRQALHITYLHPPTLRGRPVGRLVAHGVVVHVVVFPPGTVAATKPKTPTSRRKISPTSSTGNRSKAGNWWLPKAVAMASQIWWRMA